MADAKKLLKKNDMARVIAALSNEIERAGGHPVSEVLPEELLPTYSRACALSGSLARHPAGGRHPVADGPEKLG